MTLELRNVTKVMQGRAVVDNVSLTVQDGEFFVLLGTSGSGKSTILRLIAGLEKPDSGQIYLDGKEITNLPSRERNLGMVFQDYGLYPNMNVYQNIAYGLEARGLKKHDVAGRVRAAAAKLQIDHHLERSITELSGGEQQRVALARSLAKDASAYLYDEPLSNLDPKLRFSARHDIQAVHRSKQRPSLYVTHDQTEAFALADRIGVLSAGRLQQIGTVDTLMRYPVNTFVASFLGTMPINLVTGELRRENDRYRVHIGGSSVVLTSAWTAMLDAYGKRMVTVGIRPSALFMPRPAETDPLLAGTLETVEDMLGESIVVVKLEGQSRVSALLTDVDIMAFEVGRPFTLGVDVDELLLFDIDTSAALSVSHAPVF
ncbi:MAG: ABC transporter ATP-binding protein [bacterium]|nr:ABC transporter ATP-binding protein [bacterium]